MNDKPARITSILPCILNGSQAKKLEKMKKTYFLGLWLS
jgi:hypothetical protein